MQKIVDVPIYVDFVKEIPEMKKVEVPYYVKKYVPMKQKAYLCVPVINEICINVPQE